MFGIERLILRAGQWERVKHVLPGKEPDRGVTAKDNRLFLEAVLWIARTGAPWRDLPRYFGNWNSVYVRFSRWAKKGVLQSLLVSNSAAPEVKEGRVCITPHTPIATAVNATSRTT